MKANKIFIFVSDRIQSFNTGRQERMEGPDVQVLLDRQTSIIYLDKLNIIVTNY